MKMIAGGMYRTVSPKTKLPVPDDQLKAGIKKTVTKLPDPKPVTPKQRPNVGGMSKAQEDAFEKEYEAFIAQQKKLKAEREAAEAAEAAKVETAEPEVDVAEEPVDVAEEPADEVVEEGEVTAEGAEEVETIQTKPKRKKKADAE